jgi:hypothetical protein
MFFKGGIKVLIGNGDPYLYHELEDGEDGELINLEERKPY